MIIATEDKDQRRCFTYEERLAALKRSGKRCACCGKKLTTKTMTMDHIIPLSRGGKMNQRISLHYVNPATSRKETCCIFRPVTIWRLKIVEN